MRSIATTDAHGVPHCPICLEPVEREGEFCGPEHWEHFHQVIAEYGENIEMTYLTLYEQPWYGLDYG